MTVKTAPPRALHCEYPLGRPLGRPGEPEFQHDVLARAFLAAPRVLSLVEATRSLALPPELLVQAALITRLADRPAVIIAHRLSTVESADRVLVVDDGRSTADGPPHVVLPTLRVGEA